MELLPFKAADINCLAELQPLGWDSITLAFEFYLRSDFCFPIKAVIDAKVIGIGVCIMHGNVAWLAQIIVSKDFRNKGIGKQITQYLINAVPANCKTIYLIATDMGEPIYNKLGFIPEADYAFFNNGNFGDGIEHTSITPYNAAYWDELIELDTLAYGEDRSMHLKTYLKDAKLFIEHDKLEGFHLPKLGNGLIVSKNHFAGMELMKLRSKNSETFILPTANKIANKFLLDNGYNLYRVAKRMRLGEERKWDPKYIYNRVSGQIG